MASQLPLYEEHTLLGATFDAAREPAVPVSYALGADAAVEYDAGAALCDLSGSVVLLASGEPAPHYVRTAFSGRELQVAECAFEASLLGDGTLASIPLVARTGGSEFAIFDVTPRGELLASWLSFLAGVEQEGVRPFEGLQTEDVTGALVPLMLWGGAATHVLADYLKSEAELPAAGQVATVLLDERIPALVMRPQIDNNPCYIALVPPALARVVWRSLLSFTEVTPVTQRQVGARMGQSLGWFEALLDEAGKLRMTGAELRRAGVTRESYDFVGARGLVG